MTLYRKFGQVLAVLVCVVLLVMCVVTVVTNGFYTVDTEKGSVTYFYERSDFQGYLFVALAFLISAVGNACMVEHPQIATVLSVLPIAMTVYQMADDNLIYVPAAVILLLGLIHLSCNGLAWYDMRQWKQQAARAAAEAEAESAAEIAEK